MNRSVALLQMIAFGMKAVIGEQQGDKCSTEGAQGGCGMQPRKTTHTPKKKKLVGQDQGGKLKGTWKRKYMRRSKQALDAESTGHFTRKATYKCNPNSLSMECLYVLTKPVSIYLRRTCNRKIK